MRQTLLVLLFSLMLVVPVLAQSGRKGQSPKPAPTPTPSTSEPGQAQAKDSSQPSLPKEIDGEPIYTSKQVDQKARILSKPTPGYTREARGRSPHGLVTLRAVLASDETVKHIEVMVGLPDGLSEKAIEAARRIRFKPAIKDGKPVSVWVEVIYHFRLH